MWIAAAFDHDGTILRYGPTSDRYDLLRAHDWRTPMGTAWIDVLVLSGSGMGRATRASANESRVAHGCAPR